MWYKKQFKEGKVYSGLQFQNIHSILVSKASEQEPKEGKSGQAIKPQSQQWPTSSERLHLQNTLSCLKQHHHLGTKCSYTWACVVTFKLNLSSFQIETQSFLVICSLKQAQDSLWFRQILFFSQTITRVMCKSVSQYFAEFLKKENGKEYTCQKKARDRG